MGRHNYKDVMIVCELYLKPLASLRNAQVAIHSQPYQVDGLQSSLHRKYLALLPMDNRLIFKRLEYFPKSVVEQSNCTEMI